jgi:hypothetical protein
MCQLLIKFALSLLATNSLIIFYSCYCTGVKDSKISSKTLSGRDKSSHSRKCRIECPPQASHPSLAHPKPPTPSLPSQFVPYHHPADYPRPEMTKVGSLVAVEVLQSPHLSRPPVMGNRWFEEGGGLQHSHSHQPLKKTKFTISLSYISTVSSSYITGSTCELCI